MEFIQNREYRRPNWKKIPNPSELDPLTKPSKLSKQCVVEREDAVLKGPFNLSDENDLKRVKECEEVLTKLSSFTWYAAKIFWEIREVGLCWLRYDDEFGARYGGDRKKYQSNGLLDISHWNTYTAGSSLNQSNLYRIIIPIIIMNLVNLKDVDLDHIVQEGSRKFRIIGLDRVQDTFDNRIEDDNKSWLNRLLTKDTTSAQESSISKSISKNKYAVHVAMKSLELQLSHSVYYKELSPRLISIIAFLETTILGPCVQPIYHLGMPSKQNSLVWIHDHSECNIFSCYPKFAEQEQISKRKRTAALMDESDLSYEIPCHAVYDDWIMGYRRRSVIEVDEANKRSKRSEVPANYIAPMTKDEEQAFLANAVRVLESRIAQSRSKPFAIGDCVEKDNQKGVVVAIEPDVIVGFKNGVYKVINDTTSVNYILDYGLTQNVSVKRQQCCGD